MSILSPDELETFRTDGLLIIPNLLEPRALEDIEKGLSRFQISRGGERGILSRCPVVTQTASTPPVLSLVRQVLGNAAFPVRAILFDKTPEANWKVAWHQDQTISVVEQREVEGFGPWSVKAGIPHVHAPAALLERMLTVRIHLDDCSVANGPLRVLPGTHLSGKLAASEFSRLRNEHNEVVCVVPAGGAILMRPLLVHASSAAESPVHRRVLHIEYVAEPLPDGLRWAEAIASSKTNLISGHLAIIALGSNLGDSAAVLRETIGLLEALAASHFRVSSLWQSTPVDCPPGSPPFVNAAVAFEPAADETPESLLARLQALEKEFGRRPKKILNEPRPLDLDLIAFGSEIRSTSHLTLPHPRAHLRRFVLEPLNEIAPDLVLPGQNRNIRQLLAALRSAEIVTKLQG